MDFSFGKHWEIFSISTSIALNSMLRTATYACVLREPAMRSRPWMVAWRITSHTCPIIVVGLERQNPKQLRIMPHSSSAGGNQQASDRAYTPIANRQISLTENCG